MPESVRHKEQKRLYCTSCRQHAFDGKASRSYLSFNDCAFQILRNYFWSTTILVSPVSVAPGFLFYCAQCFSFFGQFLQYFFPGFLYFLQHFFLKQTHGGVSSSTLSWLTETSGKEINVAGIER